MHRLVPCLTALVCAAVLAGCGGDGEETAPGPTLPRGLASDLAAQSDAIADAYGAGDVCGAAGQADDLLDAVLVAIQEGRVPAEFQESLTGTANKLVDEIDCPEADQPPPPPEEEEEQPDCSALVEERDALEEEKKDTKGKGRERKLEEQIKALEEDIEACQQGEPEGGDGDEGDDD
ncbi:MAG: hypothetical protein ACRDNE_06755 [Gaiellaceae bacterium]